MTHNILISSAGRRSYLVQWFREALVENKIVGRVIVADVDNNAPSKTEADAFFLLPPVADENYQRALLALCNDQRISLAISINDYELSRWSHMDKAEFLSAGTRLISLEYDLQTLVEDKYEMSKVLEAHGVPSPPTFLGREVIDEPTLRSQLGEQIIIKNRYGSGSSGLTYSGPTTIVRDLEAASALARDRLGAPISDNLESLENVVVQPVIQGTEFGMDVLSDFSEQYAAAFVRKKLRMRGGETDLAGTVDSGRFEKLARQLANAIPHAGIVDTDVIEDSSGRHWVIDVNPRFGGGYPFSHLAGADAPAAYVAWSFGLSANPDWFQYEAGVISAKYLSATVVERRTDG